MNTNDIQNILQNTQPFDIFGKLSQHYPDGHPPQDVLNLVIDFYKKHPYNHTLQRDVPATWAEPTPAPAMLWCRHLRIVGNLCSRLLKTPDALATLLASPYLYNIEELTLDGYHLRDDQLTPLGQNLQKIHTLSIYSTKLTHEGLQNISQNNDTPKICNLYLGAKTLGAPGIKILERAPLFQSLTRLGISYILDPYETFEALIETGLSQRLTHLNIGNTRFDDEDASVLLKPEAWPNLKDIIAYTDGNTSMSTYQYMQQWGATHGIRVSSC